MAWKEKRNEGSSSHGIPHSGPCEFCGKLANVTSFFSRTFECKTDLQKTYRFKGYICDVQNEKGYSDPACMDKCSLIQKEF